jgi:hypothetical protein
MNTSSLLRDIVTFAASLSKDCDMKPRTVQHKIDGLVYTSRKFPASVGLELLPRVSALIGASLMRTAVTGEDSDEVGIEALLQVADRAMRDGLIATCRDLLSRMQVNELAGAKGEGGEVLADFDEHFAGEYMHLAKVCIFALAHNFRGPTLGTR